MRADSRDVTVLVLDAAILEGELIAMALSVKGHLARAVRTEAAALGVLREQDRVNRVLIDGALLREQPALARRIQLRFPVEVVVMLSDDGAVPAEALWGISGVIEKSACFPDVADRFEAHLAPADLPGRVLAPAFA